MTFGQAAAGDHDVSPAAARCAVVALPTPLLPPVTMIRILRVSHLRQYAE
jgi:hypothetical protein